jgi:hypothetical protein
MEELAYLRMFYPNTGNSSPYPPLPLRAAIQWGTLDKAKLQCKGIQCVLERFDTLTRCWITQDEWYKIFC